MNEKLIFNRQQERLTEIENWLGLLIAYYGTRTDADGWKWTISDRLAQDLRADLPRGQLSVSIDYDPVACRWTLDAL